MNELIKTKKNCSSRERKFINCGTRLIDLSDPIVMGVVNVTPDSFYDGGILKNLKSVVSRVKEIIDEGGEIIDIGASSTRPGAELITAREETNRLTPVLETIRKHFPDIIISVDTYRADIADLVVKEFNVNIINDISGGELDNKMFPTVAELQIPYILMHMKGVPGNMQINPVYEDLVGEILKFFSEKVEKLKLLGVNDIILDPGFGFGKTLDQNYQLINRLSSFQICMLPILVGISRKSMIYKLFNTDATSALNGSTVLHGFSLLGGANILRVHDVKEAVEVCRIFNKLKST